MGDRANVIFNTKKLETNSVKESLKKSVVLYTHWKGYRLGAVIRAALKKAKPRFGDDSYATRIMVSQIIGEDWPEETGFGLLCGELGDNEYPYVVIDWNAKEVCIHSEADGTLQRKLDFDNFMALADEAANAFCSGSPD